MDGLKAQIAKFNEEKAKAIPQDILETMARALRDLKESGVGRKSLKTGDRAPEFTLPDQNGMEKNFTYSPGKSPLVLNFYRGGW
ncbi:hypothetical protein [Desulfomarina sp.]